jgi:hypothetical protein
VIRLPHPPALVSLWPAVGIGGALMLLIALLTWGRTSGAMAGMTAAMANGMMAGLLGGAVGGLLFPGPLWPPTFLGVEVGILSGLLTGAPYGLPAWIEGAMAGLMGGLMGAMLLQMAASHAGQVLSLLLLCWTWLSVGSALLLRPWPRRRPLVLGGLGLSLFIIGLWGAPWG